MKRSSCGARGRDAPPKAGPAQALARAQAPPRPSGGLLSWLEKLKIKTLLLIVFIVYASVPIFIYLFPSLLQKFVYLNFLVYPLWVDFNKPEVFLSHTANFHLTTEPGITLGIWHTLPDNRRKEAEGKDSSWFEEALADDNPVLIYLHGNGGTRAASYRVALTKVMSNGGFHVLAVDYRGYADSTGYPSEDGFTTDILFLYDWVKARSGNSSVILWGHSLGTGIATNTAKELKEKGIVVDTIILEAPFTNIRDAAAHIHIAKIYRKFPGFEYLVLDTMARADMHFPSDKNVKVLSSPLLILHSEDDGVIPVHLGKKLFEVARNASTKKENVKFIAFPANQRLGHEYIYSCPNLLTIVKDFLSSVKQ
ncbi:protein ABHD12B isoform X1 [Tiliqua scincoides]|uniref:protein ABHD12B isoform X1 n=1 Tax=Tiliqua scincoides TaxID=71010 RepID=UPI0034622FD6